MNSTDSRTNASSGDDEIVIVGRIGAPYGVQGWVRVNTFTDPPQNLIDYAPWWLAPAAGIVDAAETAEPSWREIPVLEARLHQQGYVARLAGIDDRTAAERLQGYWIGVRTSQFQAPDEDEFYWRDLVGMSVWNLDGLRLGDVDRLFETGAHDIIVVNGAQGEILIPFHRQFVIDVDLDLRRLQVDWTLG